MSLPRKTIGWILFAVLVAAVGAGILRSRVAGRETSGGAHGTEQKALYQCSMHPTIISDKPENCPICGMRLTRVEKAPEPEKSSGARGKVLFYRHPMRPDVTSPEPAKDEMGMDFIPVYEEEAQEAGASKVPGHASVHISPERQRMIGVRTEVVEERPLTLSVRASGWVMYNVELAEILAGYKEVLLKQLNVRTHPMERVVQRASEVRESLEFEMALLGLSKEEVLKLANVVLLKQPVYVPTILLPPGRALVYVNIFEYEAPLIEIGQAARVTSPALPGKSFEGTVTWIDPALDPDSRTLRVRVGVLDPEDLLINQLSVDAVFEVPLGTKLALPRDALFDAGETQLAFVDQGGGHIEPRNVAVGHQAGGYYEVLEGLAKGERVVTSAAFLIDSESRLRAAVAGLSGAHQH